MQEENQDERLLVVSVKEGEAAQEDLDATQKLILVQDEAEREWTVPETPTSPSLPDAAQTTQVRHKRATPAYFIPQQEAAKVHLIEGQCRRFCLSLFFRDQDPVHSLGITSSVPGEGKSFIAIMMAYILANDSTRPVTLIECNWENAGLHDYFGFPATPGLAEWLRGECSEEHIRYNINGNLTIIPAGDGRQDAVRLLQQITKRGLRDTLAHDDENLLVDLPPVTTASYSLLAASIVEAVALVVRAGVTPDNLVANACACLNKLPMQGIILNRVEHHHGFPHLIEENV
jgi:protein-tyrosine kinase